MNLFDLSGRTALVTGGAQGLGRMMAEGLLKAGAKVVITSRKQALADQAAEDMASLGSCTAMTADFSSVDEAVNFAGRFASSVGQCDILINNAGKSWGAPIENFPDRAWPDIMSINVQIPFTLVRELLPLLKAGASPETPSRIINIGSVAGAKVERLSAYSYTSSKAAIHMLTRELAADLAADNITVNALVPGYFPTKMTAHMRNDAEVDPAALARIPLRRFGSPDDIAGGVIFLCSRAGAYVTGSQLHMDGGMIGCA